MIDFKYSYESCFRMAFMLLMSIDKLDVLCRSRVVQAWLRDHPQIQVLASSFA